MLIEGYGVAEEEKDKSDPKDTENKEGAEGQGDEGQEGLNLPKDNPSKKKLIIIAAVGGLLLLGGGVGAGLFFGGFFDPKPEVTAEGEEAHGQEDVTDQVTDHGGDEEHGEGNGAPVFLTLGDVLVNLSSSGKRPNFLKIKVSLELADAKDKEALESLKPRIIDNFQVYLRELRVEDLRGSAGLYRLREELLLRVTEAVQPIRVRDVLFQEMLVQ